VAFLGDAAAEPWLPGSHTCHHQCFPPVLPSLHDGTHGDHPHRCTCACCVYSILTCYCQKSCSPCLCICACCHSLRLMSRPCMRCSNQLSTASSEENTFHQTTSNRNSGSCLSRLFTSMVDNQENVLHHIHLCF